jgi:hypothetical protein
MDGEFMDNGWKMDGTWKINGKWMQLNIMMNI